MSRHDKSAVRDPLERTALVRHTPSSFVTGLIVGGIAAVILLPTAVVVWDIYDDRSTREMQDHRYRELDGLWRVDCGRAEGMVVEFLQTHPLEAVAMVRDVRHAKRSGYQRGEEVIRVTRRPNGTWRGRYLRRSSVRNSQWRSAALRRDGARTIGVSKKFQCLEHLSRPD